MITDIKEHLSYGIYSYKHAACRNSSIFLMSLWAKYYYYPHFLDDNTEAQNPDKQNKTKQNPLS